MVDINRRNFGKLLVNGFVGFHIPYNLSYSPKSLDFDILLLIDKSSEDWISNLKSLDDSLIEEKDYWDRHIYRKLMNDYQQEPLKCIYNNLSYQISEAEKIFKNSGLEKLIDVEIDFEVSKIKRWNIKESPENNELKTNDLLLQMYNEYSDSKYGLVIAFTPYDLMYERQKNGVIVSQPVDGSTYLGEKFVILSPNIFDVRHSTGAAVAHEIAHCFNAIHIKDYKHVEDMLYEYENIIRMSKHIKEKILT